MAKPADGSQMLEMAGMYPQDGIASQTDCIYFDKKGLFIVDTQNGLQVKGPGGLAIQPFTNNAIGLTFTAEPSDGRGTFFTVTAGHDASPGGNTSLDLTGNLNGGATRLVIHPNKGTPAPTGQAYSEWTITRVEKPNYQNLNFSAIVDAGATNNFRFGQELGGTAVAGDVNWATENGVTAGTEIYLKFASVRVGDSQPIAIVNGHLRFDTDARGGLNSTFWIGRASGNLVINVATGAAQQFTVNGAPVISLLATRLQINQVPGFQASDKYLVIDATGNVHVSALGPAS